MVDMVVSGEGKMNVFFLVLSILLVVNAFLCMIRVFIGPTLPDRILAIDVMETKTLIVLVLIAYIFRQKAYLGVALVYALLNFSITVVVARYLETGRIKEDWKS
jgi:multicomponent Na+:H+ antiporter subunit F